MFPLRSPPSTGSCVDTQKSFSQYDPQNQTNNSNDVDRPFFYADECRRPATRALLSLASATDRTIFIFRFHANDRTNSGPSARERLGRRAYSGPPPPAPRYNF